MYFVLLMYTNYRCWRITVYNYYTISPTATMQSYSFSFPNLRFSFFLLTYELPAALGNQLGQPSPASRFGCSSRWGWSWINWRWLHLPPVTRRLCWRNPNFQQTRLILTMLNKALPTLLCKKSARELVVTASLRYKKTAYTSRTII
jgi:hypothetical protein